MNKINKISIVLLSIVGLLGFSVLCGWYWNIQVLKTIVPGFISMKANTALGLMTLALASYFLSVNNSRTLRIAGLILSSSIMIFSLMTMAEYLFKINFHIDEFFFKDLDAGNRWPPGRLAPITGLSFIFISGALLLHSTNPQRFIKLTQGMMVITWIASLQALVGYMSGNSYTFGSAYYTQIALHTAIIIILLTTANLVLWSEHGYLKYLSGNGVAGCVGRKLLLAAIIVPPLINIAQVQLFKLEIFDADFGILVRVIGSIIFFAWIAMTTGKYLDEVDEKRATAEQAQLMRTEELQRALQARDDLLSICSHELRTPISSMKLQTQFVKYQMEKGDTNALSPQKMMDIIEQSDRQLDRLTKLIEDMLDFSRINSGRFTLSRENFDLHALIVNLLDAFKIQLKASQCEMILSVETEKPVMVYWDSYRIEQLVTNLITNAIKYGSRKPIELKIFTAFQATGIQVSDQGMGILPADFERIFEPYERAISVSKISGLGLGLYISKKIAEAHGGSIRVESISGVGSTFTALIPNRILTQPEESIAYGG